VNRSFWAKRGEDFNSKKEKGGRHGEGWGVNKTSRKKEVGIHEREEKEPPRLSRKREWGSGQPQEKHENVRKKESCGNNGSNP